MTAITNLDFYDAILHPILRDVHFDHAFKFIPNKHLLNTAGFAPDQLFVKNVELIQSFIQFRNSHIDYVRYAWLA